MTRVGLVGYGMAGADIHRPALLEAGLTIASVATANPERQAACRAALPDAAVVPDLSALLEHGGVDVVVLASPSGVHAEQAHAVIDAGIPLVVDKPLAVDADQALEIVDHAARDDVPLTVFQNRRYDPEFATLAAVVARGMVGEPFRFEHRWERWRPVPKARWREQASAADGGGLLLDLHAHLIDAATHLFGPIDTVFATVASRTTPAEDDAFLVCRHDSGMVSHVGALSIAGAPGPRVRLLGRDAAYVLATLDGEPVPWTAMLDAPGSTGWIVRGTEKDAVPTVAARQADFYVAVAEAVTSGAGQAGMPVDPRDAVHTLAVIDAARTSAEAERVVEVITPGQRPD